MRNMNLNPGSSFWLAALLLLILPACASQLAKTSAPGETALAPSAIPTGEVALPTEALPTSTVEPTQALPAPTETSPQASLDPCAYLSLDEITQITGETFVKTEPYFEPRPKCVYEKTPEAGGYTASIVTYIFADYSAAGAFEIGKTAQDVTEPVTGVGDEAYWSPSLDVLNILYQDIYYTVQFLGTENQSQDLAQELALKILENMQEKGVPH